MAAFRSAGPGANIKSAAPFTSENQSKKKQSDFTENLKSLSQDV